MVVPGHQPCHLFMSLLPVLGSGVEDPDMFPVVPEVHGFRVFDKHYLSPWTEVLPLDFPDHIPLVLVRGRSRVFIKPENAQICFLPLMDLYSCYDKTTERTNGAGYGMIRRARARKISPLPCMNRDLIIVLGFRHDYLIHLRLEDFQSLPDLLPDRGVPAVLHGIKDRDYPVAHKRFFMT